MLKNVLKTSINSGKKLIKFKNFSNTKEMLNFQRTIKNYGSFAVKVCKRQNRLFNEFGIACNCTIS